MKILGWIRKGDNAACGEVVAEGMPTFTVHGQPVAFLGANMTCRKNCVIAQAHPGYTLPNQKTAPHHGHVTSNGCPLISSLNDVYGWKNESDENIPAAYKQNHLEEWIPVFSPLRHEDGEHDQHLIFENQMGKHLEVSLTKLRTNVVQK